ncbi:unnamed protein product [Urochloa humidicola]
MVDSASTIVEFNVNYEHARLLADGDAVKSDAIAAGGHMWRINYYPTSDMAGHLCVALHLLSKSSDINAIFEVVLIDKDGIPVVSAAKRIWRLTAFCGTIVWLHPATAESTDLVNKNFMARRAHQVSMHHEDTT